MILNTGVTPECQMILRLKNAKLFQLIMFSVHHKTEINIDLEKVWHEIWS